MYWRSSGILEGTLGSQGYNCSMLCLYPAHEAHHKLSGNPKATSKSSRPTQNHMLGRVRLRQHSRFLPQGTRKISINFPNTWCAGKLISQFCLVIMGPKFTKDHKQHFYTALESTCQRRSTP